MNFSVRPINGTLGSAIAIREEGGEERKVAAFADASIQDVGLLGNDRCIAVSRKRSTAIFDLTTGDVLGRGRIPIAADFVSVSPDGARALAYSCSPGLLAVIDLATLEITDRFNLIQLREDGQFDLIYRDHDQLESDGTPWDSIPRSDGALHQEVASDRIWLKYAPSEPSGLRRMRFTREAHGVFRSDGKAILPFVFGKIVRTSGGIDKHETSSGIAIIDLDARRMRLEVLRSLHLPNFVRSISPDGAVAILQSHDPVSVPEASAATGIGGSMHRVFGRKSVGKKAFGFEFWEVRDAPRHTKTIPYREIDGSTLQRTNTQRFGEEQLSEARKEIDLILPGLAAAYAGDTGTWLNSNQKRIEDSYFDPLEAREAPRFVPSFRRVHYPSLFAETLQKLITLHPRPFLSMTSLNLPARQLRLATSLLNAWTNHSTHAAQSVAWIDARTFVCLSRDGTIREISTDGEMNAAFLLVHPEKREWPYSDRDMFLPELLKIRGRTLAVDLYNERIEFELPTTSIIEPSNITAVAPLTYRIVKDREIHGEEVKQVDRLAEKIRRGYIKIGSKDATRITDGLHELAREVREHLEEIVVDHRWLPSLFHRGKPVTETEFCEILTADGSAPSISALDDLLTSFVGVIDGQFQNIWHPDGGTPTMGPVALALVKLCDPIPETVMRFYAHRDMDHDMWTYQAFERLGLGDERYLKPDLLRLQIRLAIQDICTGNADQNVFLHYRLPLARAKLHGNPQFATELAKLIHEQAMAQSPRLTWATGAGVSGVVSAIADSLDQKVAGEAQLATQLSKFAGSDQGSGN